MEEQAKEGVKAKMEAKEEMEEEVEERRERQIFFSLIFLLLKTISSQTIDQFFQKKNVNKKFPKVMDTKYSRSSSKRICPM